MFKFIKNIFSPSQDQSVKEKDTDIGYLQARINRLSEIINESLNICEETTNIKTKQGRVSLAEEKLNELKALCLKHGNITLGSLPEIELLISKYKSECSAVHEESFSYKQICEMNSDIIKGYKLCVTMGINTPLKYLKRHNEVAENTNEDIPPKFGIWVAKLSSEFDVFKEGATMASDVGQIPTDGGDFLPYLIDIRKILELKIDGNSDVRDTINRCKSIEQLPSSEKYSGKVFESENSLFSHVLSETSANNFKGLSASNILELYEVGYGSIESILNAPDKVLLSLKGVGKKKLETIRNNLS